MGDIKKDPTEIFKTENYNNQSKKIHWMSLIEIDSVSLYGHNNFNNHGFLIRKHGGQKELEQHF